MSEDAMRDANADDAMQNCCLGEKMPYNESLMAVQKLRVAG